MEVLQVCAFAAPYEGNFLKSLYAIEKKLQSMGINTIYAFPETAKNRPWCVSLMKRARVYFLPLSKARIRPCCYKAFIKIYSDNPSISIVHSHFELYDIPATVTASKSTKVYWHLHDAVIRRKGLRGILDRIQFSKIWKQVTILSVSEKYRQDVVAWGFPDNQTKTVINAIDLSRINTDRRKRLINPQYKFLLFGWEFYRKGVDIAIDAARMLQEKGYVFTMFVVGDDATWEDLKTYGLTYGGTSEYIQCLEKAENVNEFYEKCDCLISASRRETFSYAVCEAAYAGLQVISSDIPGLEWAHELPTVLFFESENPSNLAKRMEESINNTIDNEKVSMTRSIIVEKYGIDQWVNTIIEYYDIG